MGKCGAGKEQGDWAGKGGKGMFECGGMSKGEWLQRKGKWLQCKGEKGKGEWMKAKAMGKGQCTGSEWAEHLSSTLPLCGFSDTLALLAQKGLGKGGQGWPSFPAPGSLPPYLSAEVAKTTGRAELSTAAVSTSTE